MTSSTPPSQVHVLDWQPALAGMPGIQTGIAADHAIERWAQACLQDLSAALPHQQHAVLAHPGNVSVPVRVYLASPQASGWLYSPLHGQPDAPHWHASAADCLQAAAERAAAHHFCAADAAILGMMGALAAIDQHCSALPDDFTRRRRHFPLLGEPRQHAFAAMPRTMLRLSHPHALYAVMGDADWVVRCMEHGVKLVQLRLKNATPDVLDSQIARCAEAAGRHGALLVINDHWQAALRHLRHRNGHGIYGVHLGQEDLARLDDEDLDSIRLAGLRLGLSTHSLWELSRALRTRPSHVACGPVHTTTTKDMPWLPLGEVNVAWWAQVVHEDAGPDHPPLPLVAIGGMHPVRAQAAAAAGADMVAVVSHITGAEAPGIAIQALREAIQAGHALRGTQNGANWPQPTLPPV